MRSRSAGSSRVRVRVTAPSLRRGQPARKGCGQPHPRTPAGCLPARRAGGEGARATPTPTEGRTQMSPLKHSNNFAARMGRWSANHWKTAVFGWLAFVVASFAIGTAIGTKYLETSDSNVGEARRADKIIKDGFGVRVDEMGEIVFVQNKKLDAHDPAFRAVIADVTRTL